MFEFICKIKDIAIYSIFYKKKNMQSTSDFTIFRQFFLNFEILKKWLCLEFKIEIVYYDL